MPSTLKVPIKRSEDMIIQALQDRLTDAEENKTHAESVFAEACKAVKVASARTSDEDIIVAIKNVQESAQNSFLEARQQVEVAKASLEVAMKEEENSHMSIPEGDRKPAAVTPHTGEAATNLDRAGTEVVTGDLENGEEAIIAHNDDGVEALTARVGNEQGRNEADDGLLESYVAAAVIAAAGVQTSTTNEERSNAGAGKTSNTTTTNKVVPPGELTVVGCGVSELNGVYTNQYQNPLYLKRGIWDGEAVNFKIRRGHRRTKIWLIQAVPVKRKGGISGIYKCWSFYYGIGESKIVPPLNGWIWDMNTCGINTCLDIENPNPPEVVYE